MKKNDEPIQATPAITCSQRMKASTQAHRISISMPFLDAFCAAFNARDIDGLTSLLLDHVTLDFPGLHTDYGAAAARRALGTTMSHASLATAPEWRHGMLEASARFESRTHRGEQIVLAWWQHEDGEAVRGFSIVDSEGDRIAAIRTYFHTPEAIAELCRELGLPYRTNGYRFWW